MLDVKPQLRLLFKRFAFLLLLYSLCRLLFYTFNHSLFSFSSGFETIKMFVYGIRFDIYAIVITNAVFILLHLLPVKAFYNAYYQKTLYALYLLFNIPAILLNCVDFAYFKFILKRSTLDVLTILKPGEENIAIHFAFDFWYIFIVAACLIALLVKGYKKIIVPAMPKNTYKQALQVLYILGVIILACIGARGGLQYRPLGLLDATQVTEPAHAPIVLNTPFSIIRTLSKNELKDVQYMPEDEAARLFSTVHTPKTADNNGFKKLNVVIIILEGIGKEYIGSLSHYKTHTPFLDSLMPHSMVFTDAYANGKRSIEGIPAIVASLPTLMNNSFITSAYAGNKINSLASILKQEGYQTSFYHGGNNGTMGFDNFTQAVGYEKYYGRKEYNNDTDYDGNWGIFDEPFLQYFANSLSKTKQPFFSTVFTLSSHHPFTIPSQYKGKFKKESLPIYATVEYTDYALKQFFATARMQPWYSNTLFVITSDHTAIAEHDFYKTPAGLYAIPIIFFKPNSNLQGSIGYTVQQTDIMPGILDYLHYRGSYTAFGQSLFDSSATRWAISFNNGVYELIQQQHVLLYTGSSTLGLYNFGQDSLQQYNLLNTNKEITAGMEKQLKAIIQIYNHSMIYNKLLPNK